MDRTAHLITLCSLNTCLSEWRGCNDVSRKEKTAKCLGKKWKPDSIISYEMWEILSQVRDGVLSKDIGTTLYSPLWLEHSACSQKACLLSGPVPKKLSHSVLCTVSSDAQSLISCFLLTALCPVMLLLVPDHSELIMIMLFWDALTSTYLYCNERIASIILEKVN